ncbi:MAG TPA: ABC transporter permease [Acidobacteriaceae bacterium]|nr:ABC transporter permease [Acidobacteriaceae bacterium]
MKWWQIRKRNEDLERELRSALELEEEEQRDRGLSPDEAHYAARRAFGNATLIREQTHESWVSAPFERFLQDLRYALRQFRRSPGFASTAILVLALGIGVSVAIFGFVDAALLEPLPYANPNRLMSVNESSIESPRWPLSYPDFLDWRRLNNSFSSLDIYTGAGFLLRAATDTEPVQGERVSGGFLMTLGVHPILGRDFNADEDRLGGPNVVILSYGAWNHRFGGRRDVIGQTVDLDNQTYTIIGVLPRSFTFAPSGNAEFWAPINTLSPHQYSRTFYSFMGIGRLRDGVTPRTAQAEMTAIAKTLQQQYALTGRSLSASVLPLSEVFIGDVRPILVMLLAGAGLLLLIACVNVASLVLVRSESRKREVAVRGALGATPARLLRQFVTEGLLFAALGTISGLMVASGLMKLLAGVVPRDMAANMPFVELAGLNAHTGAFAAAVALLAALLLAIIPALLIPLRTGRNGLAEADRGGTSMFWRRLGGNLVVVELAIAVVLLAGAGLLAKSFYRLLHVPLGFDPDHLATVRVMIPRTAYTNNDQTLTLYREIMRRVSSLPGVESAGDSNRLPVECNCPIDGIQIVGRPFHGEHNEVDERHVSPDYLPTLRATLLRGRGFTEADDSSTPGVAIVNQALVNKYFPGQEPIGQRIANDEGGRPSQWEIVGVVDDVHEGPLDEETWPAEYFPINQTMDLELNLAVRTRQYPGVLLPALVAALHQLDPRLGVSEETTLTAKIGNTEAALLHRFSAYLVGGFAAMALLLGLVGLYGVTAYSVSQRTREIGVRMALGAQRSGVYRLVIGQAVLLTSAGLAIGLVGSIGTSLFIRKLLFAVPAWDVATLAAVAFVLALTSLAASLLPARRAASIDPVQALRCE